MYGERSVEKKNIKYNPVGQSGIVRMKALMRRYVFWPNMDKEIEENVKSCRDCAIAAIEIYP